MNFESFRGALRFEYGVVDNLYFSENNGNVTYTACDRDGPEIAITAPVGEMVTDYANLILERRSGSPCVKSLCDELDAIISAGDDVLYKSYVAARQYGEHAFAWSVAMEVYTDLDGKRKDNNITFKWRINLNALMCWDFISGWSTTGACWRTTSSSARSPTPGPWRGPGPPSRTRPPRG